MNKKLSFITAMLGIILMADIAWAESPPSAEKHSNEIVIEVVGHVPGYEDEELGKFLAQGLQQEMPSPWHFITLEHAQNNAVNRVVWSFKALETMHKDAHTLPAYTEIYLRVEVKLYKNGQYEMTINIHPTLQKGDRDKAILEMVHTVAQALPLH